MSDLKDFIPSLFRDETRAEVFIKDPKKALHDAGLANVTAAQVQAAVSETAPQLVLDDDDPISGLQRVVANYHSVSRRFAARPPDRPPAPIAGASARGTAETASGDIPSTTFRALAWSTEDLTGAEPFPYSASDDEDRPGKRTALAWYARPGLIFAIAAAVLALVISGGVGYRLTVRESSIDPGQPAAPVSAVPPAEVGVQPAAPPFSPPAQEPPAGSPPIVVAPPVPLPLEQAPPAPPQTKQCPDGTTIPNNQACPAKPAVITCPDGTTVPNGQTCPAKPAVTTCPDGTTVPNGQTCPYVHCPGGTSVPNGQTCPPVHCPDGITVPNGQTCPPVHCPDGTSVPNGQTCPPVHCPDGITVPNGQTCPPVHCPDGTSVSNGQTCPPVHCPDGFYVPNGQTCPAVVHSWQPPKTPTTKLWTWSPPDPDAGAHVGDTAAGGATPP